MDGGAKWAVTAVAALFALPMLIIVMVSGSGTPATAVCAPAVVGDELSDGSDLTAEMVENAVIIMQVGDQMGVPATGQAIALATALVESSLRNLNYGDRDSLGLFQQRPSKGWGSPQQILDPAYATGKFYEKLLRVPDWESKDPGSVAQAVQISAFPDRYGQRMGDARRIQAGILESAEECQNQPATGELVEVAGADGPAILVDASIAGQLDALIQTALADGVRLGGSGWRSQEAQIELRKKNGCPNIWTAPASSCRVPTAIPGTSLHEVGLAIDFTCNGGGSVSRGNACDRWLMANAGGFGFKNLASEAWHYSTTGN